MNKNIPLCLSPVMALFVASVLYSGLIVFEPYYTPWMFDPEFIAIRNRIIIQFSCIFGLLAVFAVWLISSAWSPPCKPVKIVSGVLASWPILTFVLISLGLITDEFLIAATIVIPILSTVVTLWGIFAKYWLLPSLTTCLLLLFMGSFYWYAVDVIALFGD